MRAAHHSLSNFKLSKKRREHGMENSPVGHFWALHLSWPAILLLTVPSLLLQLCRRSSTCSQVMWRWPRERGLSWPVVRHLDILSPTSSGRRMGCPSTTLIHTTRSVLCNFVLVVFFKVFICSFEDESNTIRCQCHSVSWFTIEVLSYRGFALTRSHSHNAKTPSSLRLQSGGGSSEVSFSANSQKSKSMVVNWQTSTSWGLVVSIIIKILHDNI